MRRLQTLIVTVKMVFLVGLIVGMSGIERAQAAASFERPSGDPPFGQMVHGEAKGTKLIGIMTVEFTDYEAGEDDFAGGARVVLRLRQGSQLGTFFSVVNGPINLNDPLSSPQIIINSLGQKIVSLFSPGDCFAETPGCTTTDEKTAMSLLIKETDELGFNLGAGKDLSPCTGGQSAILVLDIVLAMAEVSAP